MNVNKISYLNKTLTNMNLDIKFIPKFSLLNKSAQKCNFALDLEKSLEYLGFATNDKITIFRMSAI
ncbi:MAG: hypothetical protein CVV24_14715 [Ignavibacteriae bacterium HGW-Ignavibacteriae-3]|nr:MAG: hypothetical protein CVV24_14715 [Ignavibacteriae bacterium HGW-Ignavibacteriae-3]